MLTLATSMFVLVSVSQVHGHLSPRWYSCTIWADLGPRGPRADRAAHFECSHTTEKETRGAEGGSKNNIQGLEWRCTEDDIFFERQCNTKLFSIAFT